MRLTTTWALAALGAITATGCAQDDLLETRTMALAATPLQLASSTCDPADIQTDPALVYDDLARLEAHFQLRDVLDQLLVKADVDTPTSSDDVWGQWWRSNLLHDPLAPVDEPRCGDGEGADINGFPLVCNRPEEALADAVIETHQPVQLVNRFDLMPLDGSHCGEYRIVYAMKDSPGVQALDGENLIIFEGVVPNPDEGCGAAGCRPIVDFWARLSDLDEDTQIAELQRFYFEGLVELGVQPVIRPEAYGMDGGDTGYGGGRGQIRTNQFVGFQSWTLREYHLDRECTTETITPKPTPKPAKFTLAAAKHTKTKTKRRLTKKSFSLAVAPKPKTKTTCKLVVRPAPVAGNPFPGLFTGSDADALLFQAGPDDEASFLSQLDAMIHTEPLGSGAWPSETVNHITMDTDPRWNAAESIESGGNSQFPLNQYDIPTESAFAAAVVAALPAAGPYAVEHIANRATAASCAGCHKLSSSFDRRDLGNDVQWDAGTFFTHVDRLGFRSNIMDDEFLPHRKSTMARYLAKTCDTCLDKPLLRDVDDELLTVEDLDLNAPGSGKAASAAPSASPTLAKDVVQLGGKATLSGSQTH